MNKNKNMRSLFFAGILFFSFVFSALPQVAHSQACPTGFTPRAGVCFPTSASTQLSDQSVVNILLTVMNWLLAILGIFGIIAFVISGLQYMLAAGDERSIDTAKTNMKYSIIGVIVALSGYIVIQAIERALNATPFF